MPNNGSFEMKDDFAGIGIADDSCRFIEEAGPVHVIVCDSYLAFIARSHRSLIKLYCGAIATGGYVSDNERCIAGIVESKSMGVLLAKRDVAERIGYGIERDLSRRTGDVCFRLIAATGKQKD